MVEHPRKNAGPLSRVLDHMRNRTEGVAKDAMNRKSLQQFLRDIFSQWIEDEPFLLASSLSYYSLFSLTPLLVICYSRCGRRFWPRGGPEPDR